MRLYNNPWMAIAYLLGIGAKTSKDKLQNAFDTRDERKESESMIKFNAQDEEERKQRGKILDRREKWATRCFLIVLFYIFLSFLFCFIPLNIYIDLPPALATLIITFKNSSRTVYSVRLLACYSIFHW